MNLKVSHRTNKRQTEKVGLPLCTTRKFFRPNELVLGRPSVTKTFQYHQSNPDDQYDKGENDDYLDRTSEKRDECNEGFQQVDHERKNNDNTASDTCAFKN